MESKRLGKSLGIVGAALTAIAIGAPLAQAEVPASKYRQFAGCPSPKSENPETSSCARISLSAGHLRLGKKEVPLKAPMFISGGTNSSLENFSFNSKGGLLPVKQPVPLGASSNALASLSRSMKVDPQLYLVAELAGPLRIESVEDTQLLLKVHLINGALGNSCYIGSDAHPISLSMTGGTTTPPPPVKPLTGRGVSLVFDETTEMLLGVDGVLVANAFAVPGAEGCVANRFLGLPAVKVNGLVNETMGLPAPAGFSEMVENFGFEFVDSRLVYP